LPKLQTSDELQSLFRVQPVPAGFEAGVSEPQPAATKEAAATAITATASRVTRPNQETVLNAEVICLWRT
jgi:hypothetical protein